MPFLCGLVVLLSAEIYCAILTKTSTRSLPLTRLISFIRLWVQPSEPGTITICSGFSSSHSYKKLNFSTVCGFYQSLTPATSQYQLSLVPSISIGHTTSWFTRWTKFLRKTNQLLTKFVSSAWNSYWIVADFLSAGICFITSAFFSGYKPNTNVLSVEWLSTWMLNEIYALSFDFCYFFIVLKINGKKHVYRA
jgi:hypothetical protein